MTSRRGEEPGAPAAGDLATKTAEELERDISETRERLGDTVDAISHKADVKGQLKGAADEQQAKLTAKRERLGKRFSAGGGGGGDAARQARRVADGLAERTSRQPLPYLGGALVVGVIAGRMLARRGSNR